MSSKFGLPTFVKWAGGKQRVVAELKKFFPSDFNRYFEPFLGSGAVFFFISKSLYMPKKCFLSDINEDLINAFSIVRDKPDKLIDLLKLHKTRHTSDPKKYYYKVRDLIDISKLSETEAAARFIYLNRTCFNGLFRVNLDGKFNVPLGKYKNPGILNEKVIREASKLLKNAILKSGSYEKLLRYVRAEDFVYLDPPYHPISKTSNFTKYSTNCFNEEDQKKLAEMFKKLDGRGAHVMLCNSSHKFIKDLYSDYSKTTFKLKSPRAICCNGDGRGKISELVILNYIN